MLDFLNLSTRNYFLSDENSFKFDMSKNVCAFLTQNFQICFLDSKDKKEEPMIIKNELRFL